MCLVRLWKQVFLAIAIADLFSQNNSLLPLPFLQNLHKLFQAKLLEKLPMMLKHIQLLQKIEPLSVASWKPMKIHLNQRTDSTAVFFNYLVHCFLKHNTVFSKVFQVLLLVVPVGQPFPQAVREFEVSYYCSSYCLFHIMKIKKQNYLTH